MGATVGTRFMTWWKGERVGEDEFGNVYYRSRKGDDRRWVIYADRPEASAVPPDWHAWLHKTVEHPPVGEHAPPQPSFHKDHEPNLTGSAAAYRPTGSMSGDGKRASATGDYTAWSPDD